MFQEPIYPFPDKPSWEFMPNGIPRSLPYYGTMAVGQLIAADIANNQLQGGQLGLAGGVFGVGAGQLAADAIAARDMTKFVNSMNGAELYDEARKSYITPELRYADQLNENNNRAKLMSKQLLVAAGLPIVGTLLGKLANDNLKSSNKRD